MSEWKEQGGPAFPALGAGGYTHKGMSLRDYFAAKALNAILRQEAYGIQSNHPDGVINSDGETAARRWAQDAYAIADAMLAERDK